MHAATTPTRPISVAIVEDDTEIRGVIAGMLAGLSDMLCVGQFGSGEAAVKNLPALHPDVVLMDIGLRGMDGIECVRRVSAELPEARMVMLTIREDADAIFASLAAGADGYLLKPPQATQLLEAVRNVYVGGVPMNSVIARKVIESFRKPSPIPDETANLSPRELAVLQLLARGLAVKEIADQLELSFFTIREYTERIYKKLRVRSRAQAVAKLFGLPSEG